MCVPNDYNEIAQGNAVKYQQNGLLTPETVTQISNELTKEMSSLNIGRPST